MWSCTFILAVGCCPLEPLTSGTGSRLRGGIDPNQLQAYLLNELSQRGYPRSEPLTTQEKQSSCFVCVCLSGIDWSGTSWIPICLRSHWAWKAPEIKTWIQEVVLLNIRLLGSKDGCGVSVSADLKPGIDLKQKSSWFRTLKVKKRWKPCWWIPPSVCSDGHGCRCGWWSEPGFLGVWEPIQASILNLSFFSTKDEHYCEMCVQVWCVTVKQHF